MKESDWKLFRKRVPEWRERYLIKCHLEIANSFKSQDKTPTEIFWHTKEKFDAIAKVLERCLDGHSRSKMEMYLLTMHGHQMIFDSDLKDFSEELRQKLLNCINQSY